MSKNEDPHIPEGPSSAQEARYERLCAYAFGELDEAQRAEMESELANDPELAEEHARLVATVGLVQEALPPEALPVEMRATLSAAAKAQTIRSGFRFLRGGLLRAAAALLALLGGAFLWMESGEYPVGGDDQVARMESSEADDADGRRSNAKSAAEMKERELSPEMLDELTALGYSGGNPSEQSPSDLSARPSPQVTAKLSKDGESLRSLRLGERRRDSSAVASSQPPPAVGARASKPKMELALASQSEAPAESQAGGSDAFFLGRGEKTVSISNQAEGLIGVSAPRGSTGAASAQADRKKQSSQPGEGARAASGPARTALALQEPVSDEPAMQESLGLDSDQLRMLESLGYTADDSVPDSPEEPAALSRQQVALRADQLIADCRLLPGESPGAMYFRWWGEHPFVRSAEDPLSTFSIDVDSASYTLARRMLRAGNLPAREQVRTEEFVNYFAADQPAPEDGPFAIGLESAPSRFHADPRVELLRVTVRGKDVEEYERQPMTLTFVIDVSGSMQGQRISMIQRSLELLLEKLSSSDSVALVSYSDKAELVSPMVSVANRAELFEAIEGLRTSGRTNIEAGLRMGYQVAKDALTPGSVNRVFLLSDGVGNIGETDSGRLLAGVQEARAEGIYLNTLGVGMANHNDTFLEQLADRGDGMCLYIDSDEEARHALLGRFTSLLQPIARDVKIQVEFDPTQVESYRQLGYENRALADADFQKDAVDAGEVNAGHQVTALYEIVRQSSAPEGRAPVTVRVRYKPPFAVDGGNAGAAAARAAEVALEVERSLEPEDCVPSFQGASHGYRLSVLAAQFAEVLRRSVHARGDSLEELVNEVRWLAEAREDPEVMELAQLVQLARPHVRGVEQQESDELLALLDQLSLLHYERGVRELVDKEELDEEALAEFEENRIGLEERVRAILGERFGERSLDEDLIEQLKRLGYVGEGEE